MSPEFPTGNGKVDLPLRCASKQGIYDVDAHWAPEARGQAAQYAKPLGLGQVTVAIFVRLCDETVLATLSVQEVTEGVEVTVVAIGWV